MATENGTYYYEFIIWFSDCPRVMMIVCVIVVYLVMSWRESKNKGEKKIYIVLGTQYFVFPILLTTRRVEVYIRLWRVDHRKRK